MPDAEAWGAGLGPGPGLGRKRRPGWGMGNPTEALPNGVPVWARWKTPS